MAAQNMPAAEIDITVDLVHALIVEQHPDLAELELSPAANGWDNAIFRLGANLAVRVPAPPDAPLNPFCGQPVAELRPRVRANAALLGSHIDTERVLGRFDRLASVDEWRGEPLWLHGDLHSANILVAGGCRSRGWLSDRRALTGRHWLRCG